MNWVTRRGIKINRAATAWLIRRFIDRDATFVFVGGAAVAAEAKRLDGVGFHAPGTAYPARDGQGRTPRDMTDDAPSGAGPFLHSSPDTGRGVRSGNPRD